MKTNALILGPIGSGKTFSLRTLLPEYPELGGNGKPTGRVAKGAGLSVRLLAHEPGWEATNGDLTCEMGFHVRQHLPADIPWPAAQEWAERIGTMSMKAVADMEVSSAVRRDYQQFVGLYRNASHFICERCGEDFGMVDSWSEDTVYCQDGLSGISSMAIHLVNGPKPIMSLPQYLSAQTLIENYVKKCAGITASYVLLAHWSREQNEVQGGSSITIDTVGQKLAPKLLRIFDEIIVAQREGNKYSWSTEDPRIDLKARRLPYSNNIEPSFAQILKNG